MSTRSSIMHTNNGTHVYEETSEPNGNGWNIYYTAFWREYSEVEIDGAELVVKPCSGIEAARFPVGDLFDLQFDSEGFSFGIAPGSTAALILDSFKERFLQTVG